LEVEEQEDLGNMEIEKIEALKDKHIDPSRIFYEKSGYSYVTYYYLIDVVCTSKYNVKAVCVDMEGDLVEVDLYKLKAASSNPIPKALSEIARKNK